MIGAVHGSAARPGPRCAAPEKRFDAYGGPKTDHGAVITAEGAGLCLRSPANHVGLNRPDTKVNS